LEYLIEKYNLRDPGAHKIISITEICYEKKGWKGSNKEMFMTAIIFRIPQKKGISLSAEELSATEEKSCFMDLLLDYSEYRGDISVLIYATEIIFK
jgi:hypothetical protein